MNRYTKLRSAKLLFSALLNNIDILSVLLFLLAICNVLFAGFIYTFEQQQQATATHDDVNSTASTVRAGGGSSYLHDYSGGFSSIPETFWFTLITMTSVGYGDVIPQSAGALFVACATGMTGIIFITFVLQSVVSEFHSLMISNAEYDAYSKRRHAASYTDGKGKRNSKSDAAYDDTMYSKRGPAFCDQEMPYHHRPYQQHSPSTSALSTPVSAGGTISPSTNNNSIEIVLNVNGAEFSVMDKELARFPHTLLGSRKRRAKFFYPPEGTYYFPRDRDSFPSIHYFYRSGGNLRRPPTVDLRRFVEEVIFFDLGASALIDLLESEGITLRHEEVEPESPRKLYWWKVFERPEFNFLSRIVAILSMTATAISVIIFCAETMPELASPSYCENFKWIFSSRHGTISGSVRPAGEPRVHINCAIELGLFITETLCCIWFIIELVVRFIVTPRKTQFISGFMNWVDLLAILPYMFTVVDKIMGENYEFVGVNALGLLRVMRLVKLIRVFKFSRHSKRIQMVADIIRASITELVMSVYFLIIACTLFGSLAYIAESTDEPAPATQSASLVVLSADEIVDNMRRDRQHISSIPAGMYWAWITMLTIGYGDLVPQTVPGKFFGGATAIMGIIFWSLPLTIVSDKFNQFRQLYRDRDYLISVLRKCKRQRRRQEEIYQDVYQSQPTTKGDKRSPYSSPFRRPNSEQDGRIHRWRDKLTGRHQPKETDNISESDIPLTGWQHPMMITRRAASTDGALVNNANYTTRPSRYSMFGTTTSLASANNNNAGGFSSSSNNLLAPPTEQWFTTSSAATSMESITAPPFVTYESATECPTIVVAAAAVRVIESTIESQDAPLQTVTTSAPRLVAAAIEVTDKPARDDITIQCTETTVACSPPIVTAAASYVDMCLVIPATPLPAASASFGGTTTTRPMNPLQQQILAAKAAHAAHTGAGRHRSASTTCSSTASVVSEAVNVCVAEAGPREYVSVYNGADDRRASVESRESTGSGSLAHTSTRSKKSSSKRQSVGSHDSGSQNNRLCVGQISAGDRIDSWADLNRYDDDDQVQVANRPPLRTSPRASDASLATDGGSRKSTASPHISAMIKRARENAAHANSSSQHSLSSSTDGGTPPQQHSPSQSPLSMPKQRPPPSAKLLYKRKSSHALLGGSSAGGASSSQTPPLLSRAVMSGKRMHALPPLKMPHNNHNNRRGSGPTALFNTNTSLINVASAADNATSYTTAQVYCAEVEPTTRPQEVVCSVTTMTMKSGDGSKKSKTKRKDSNSKEEKTTTSSRKSSVTEQSVEKIS